jgi:hypothetical protein
MDREQYPLVAEVLDYLDDPHVRSPEKGGCRLSRRPQLTESARASLRLGRGVELELADHVARLADGARYPVAANTETGAVDRIAIERGFPHVEVPDRVLELKLCMVTPFRFTTR